MARASAKASCGRSSVTPYRSHTSPRRCDNRRSGSSRRDIRRVHSRCSSEFARTVCAVRRPDARARNSPSNRALCATNKESPSRRENSSSTSSSRGARRSIERVMPCTSVGPTRPSGHLSLTNVAHSSWISPDRSTVTIPICSTRWRRASRPEVSRSTTANRGRVMGTTIRKGYFTIERNSALGGTVANDRWRHSRTLSRLPCVVMVEADDSFGGDRQQHPTTLRCRSSPGSGPGSGEGAF